MSKKLCKIPQDRNLRMILGSRPAQVYIWLPALSESLYDLGNLIYWTKWDHLSRIGCYIVLPGCGVSSGVRWSVIRHSLMRSTHKGCVCNVSWVLGLALSLLRSCMTVNYLQRYKCSAVEGWLLHTFPFFVEKTTCYSPCSSDTRSVASFRAAYIFTLKNVMVAVTWALTF